MQTQNGQTVLMEISDETFSYDRNGDWQISSLTTSVGADGTASTEAIMRQPLAGKPLSCAAFLPYPDQILDCALHGKTSMIVCVFLVSFLNY